MSSLSAKEVQLSSSRYSNVDQQKSAGATYTPADFADFLADQIVQSAELPKCGKIRILDPAVGDGALIYALLKRLPDAVHKRVEVFGYDTDANSVALASSRIEQSFPNVNIQIEQKDFLDHVLSINSFSDVLDIAKVQAKFHLIIANPPYVRTQVMGAKQAQKLAQNFGLSGRVDMYYPFLIGISQMLVEGGVTGVITSNRFMTTKSGQAVRRELLSIFKVEKVWDFGDTKLFEAAVLPAVLLAKGLKDRRIPNTDGVTLSTIYETKDHVQIRTESIFNALAVDDDTVVSVPDGRHFRIRHGGLENGGDPEGVWRVSTKSTDKWLGTVEANTWETFRRIGKVRVGVKSTADKVFIRSNWSELPGGRPELLHPLITRHHARQFKSCTPKKDKHIKEILYPHEMTTNGRRAVDLSLYPKAASYLELHRDVLEARSYLIEAGRSWYEMWGPQDPSAWPAPKIVFPDISGTPSFWMETGGGIVNGECYWIKCEKEGENDLLWLALAVANSTFIEAFYDHRFNNKLYAGKRRFITQYVELFPLPDPDREEAKIIIALAKSIYNNLPSSTAEQQIVDLDALVWSVFGLDIEEVSR